MVIHNLPFLCTKMVHIRDSQIANPPNDEP